MHKIVQSGGSLGRLWGPLLITGLPLIKNVFKPSAKSVLIIISNEVWIMKIVKSLEESGLLIKYVSETIQNEVKYQKGEFLSMLLGTLGDSLLANLLTGEGTIRAGQDF